MVLCGIIHVESRLCVVRVVLDLTSESTIKFYPVHVPSLVSCAHSSIVLLVVVECLFLVCNNTSSYSWLVWRQYANSFLFVCIMALALHWRLLNFNPVFLCTCLSFIYIAHVSMLNPVLSWCTCVGLDNQVMWSWHRAYTYSSFSREEVR